MSKYIDINTIKNTVILGDNIEVLKTLPDNSIDAVVTDPPYGLGKEPNANEVLQSWITTGYHEVKGKGFMGKGWDAFVPQPNFWKEVYRVLKPGGHVLSFAGTRTYDWTVMAVRLAGFEIRDMISWVYGCLDETSEIFTTDGWKTYKEIKEGDTVFSFVNGKAFKNKVNQVFTYNVENEPMCYIKNDNTDQLITRNHKMIIKKQYHLGEDGKSRIEWDHEFRYIDAWNRPAKYMLPLGAIYDGSLSIGTMKAELLGWIISEGHFHKDTNAISLYQSDVNKDKVHRIKYLLGRLGIKYSEYKRERQYKDRNYVEHQFYIPNKDNIVDEIKEVIPDNKLNTTLLDLTYKEKLSLIKGLCEGDGAKDPQGVYRSFYQKGLDQLELFQVLLHLSNNQGRISEHKNVVEIHHNPTTQISTKHKQEDQIYTGVVWSVNTELGSYMARRNGRIFFTGNSGFPKNHDISKAIDKQAPNHELAKKYEGWGTALKPAVEPIVLARKPFKGTVAENVIKYGTGGINIDATRVPASESDKYDIRHYTNEDCFINNKPKVSEFQVKPKNDLGRFPANLIHDSSEEVLKHFPTTKSSGGSLKAQDYKEGDGATNFRRGDFHGYGDEGSAARFFYTSKASQKERNAGLDVGTVKNIHPTLKPISLMRYLIKLITPVDGIVLDPFVGAGSTAIAAVLEHRDFIAIEMEPEYVEIAELRIKHWGKTLDE